MRKVWQKAMAVMIAIVIGMALGAGCGSEKKKGNKRRSQAVNTRGGKAEGGGGQANRKIGQIAWLTKPLAEIKLKPAQIRKIEAIRAT